jgi:hypothetical protein
MDAAATDCMALCFCTDPNSCAYVCPRNPDFAKRVVEIGGFDFANVPRVPGSSAPQFLPCYAPIIYDGYSRKHPVDYPVVAVPLMDLIDSRRSVARWTSRQGFLDAFRLLPDTRVIVTGVAADREVERWWGLPDRRKAIRSLIPLEPTLMTVPNFSAVADAPRFDNLYALKRTLLAWSEFMREGISCALHLNGRTQTDYDRFTAFVRERPEVNCLAVEFTTGGRRLDVASELVEHLIRLAQLVDRPLTLIVRGGQRWLPKLSSSFEQVVFVDAAAHQRAKFRQVAGLNTGAHLTWQRQATSQGEAIDELLRTNILTSERAIVELLGRATDASDGKAVEPSPLGEDRVDKRRRDAADRQDLIVAAEPQLAPVSRESKK